MKSILLKSAAAAICLTLTGWAASAIAADSPSGILKEGGKLAIIGDSITEQKLYSNYIETYLRVCHPELKQNVCQFGWGGERASGYVSRMANDTLSWFKPDAATICYGMNDGRYTKITPEIEKAFEDPSIAALKKFNELGTKVVLGGPGAVDTKFFRPGTDMAAVYNDNLATLSGIAERIAKENGAIYVPLHKLMIDAMAKAKAANGADFPVCGTDGVHPGGDGHLVMAYAFLKGLGVSGDIASIEYNYKDSAASFSDGLKSVSVGKGSLEFESSRYPFCFFGNAKTPDTASMLPFIPFNEDLNRFVFKAKGLPWDKVKVTWGTASKDFSKDDLEKGINLAAEFVDANPFKDQFQKVAKAVADKQGFETIMIKSFFNNLPKLGNPEFRPTTDAFRDVTIAKRKEYLKAADDALVPVKSTIKLQKAE